MNISILTFGFGHLMDWQEELYEPLGFDPEAESEVDEFFESWNDVSGDSMEAFSLAREFERLGHDATVTHYQNADKVNDWSDLILSLGAGGVIEEYQSFGDATAIYWWWACGGYQDDPGDMNFAENHLLDSEFDGVLTNGRVKIDELRNKMPTRHVHVGYDQREIKPGLGSDRYSCDITYLGVGNYKRQEQYDMLFEPATEYDFRIYGAEWEGTKYEPYHHGILPRGDIGELYNSASVVLGLHHDYIKLGMVNGRVFRALATDSIFVDQYHEQLDAEMGEYINMVESQDEMEALLADIFDDPSPYEQKARKGGEYVRSNHSYDMKCEEIIDFYHEISG